MFARWTAVRRLCLTVGCAMVVLLGPTTARSQSPGVRLDVWMLTFGPGQPVFLKFGHNAILVRAVDTANDTVKFERVYDYGLFDGSSPTLVADFLQGRMRYWMGVTTLGRTKRNYRRTNRDIYAQKLRLTPEQSRSLYRRLQDNAKPENRYYSYDYYYDNCSTRVRDVLDEVTAGALKAAFQGPASMSLRDHSLRHTHDDWKYYLGLDLGLANVDEPIDVWTEAFLPFKLREALRRVQVEQDGQRVPLVEREEVWFDGTRPDAAEQPPSRVLLLTMVGLAIGALLAAIGGVGRRIRAVGWLFVVLAAAIAFGLSLFGLLLIFLWGFTDHSIAYANQNIFNLAPWAVVAPVVAVWSRRGLFGLLAVSAAWSALGLVLKVLPFFEQDTFRITGLLLPVWCGLALGAWWVATRPRTDA